MSDEAKFGDVILSAARHVYKQDRLARAVNTFRREFPGPIAVADVKRAMQAVLEQQDATDAKG